MTRRAYTFGLAVYTQKGISQGMCRWIVYYSDQAGAKEMAPYDHVILDSRYHPPLTPLKREGRTIYGYLSLGEASEDYSYTKDLEKESLLLRPSEFWKGNRFIDIRDRRWADRVCRELVPGILARGFQGLFLDTLDSPLSLEASHRGMLEAAKGLIVRLRGEFPQVKIALNRSYALLPAVAKQVDVVVGESVYATYDFQTKRYGLVEPALHRKQVSWLRGAQAKNAKLKVFTLDYWEPDDKEGIAKIYRVQRGNGFCPYVSTIDLRRILPGG